MYVYIYNCVYIYIFIYGDELNPAQISYLYQRFMDSWPHTVPGGSSYLVANNPDDHMSNFRWLSKKMNDVLSVPEL